MSEPLLIGKSAHEILLLPQMVNRHGLIAGATGTGKTVSLQVIAEALSSIGVPLFMADVKGDLSGIAQAAQHPPKIAARAVQMGIPLTPAGCPVVFWDVFGEAGHPARATVSEMGPLLLTRMLNLNDTQSGVMNVVFRVADDQGLLLLDLKDLRAMLQHVADNAKQYSTQYGRVSAASVGTIQRGLLALEEQGGNRLFGEPALNVDDLMQTDDHGRGVINILAADRLLQSPKLYATFLLWLLSELFEALPEVGDPEKPRLVFFFDEAHLLFEDAPKVLLDKIEQVVRLIRSKGVGVFFCTQNPLDIPDDVLGQLGNRVQHALRAFTPRDQKTVRAAAQTFRQNTSVDVEKAITELAVGEALISLLDEKGTPQPVERALVRPPNSQIGPITPEQRRQIIGRSVLAGHYENAVDRESAYELLKQRAATAAAQAAPAGGPAPWQQSGYEPPSRPQYEPQYPPAARRAPGRPREGMGEAMMKSAARAAGSQLGRALLRGVLGSLMGGRRR